MQEEKPKNSKGFAYRIIIGSVAFLVLVFGLYYFVNKNKPSADTQSASTQPQQIALTNYKESLPWNSIKCQVITVQAYSSGNINQDLLSYRDELFNDLKSSNSSFTFYNDESAYDQDVAKCKGNDADACSRLAHGIRKMAIKPGPCEYEKKYDTQIASTNKTYGKATSGSTEQKAGQNTATITVNVEVKNGQDAIANAPVRATTNTWDNGHFYQNSTNAQGAVALTFNRSNVPANNKITVATKYNDKVFSQNITITQDSTYSLKLEVSQSQTSSLDCKCYGTSADGSTFTPDWFAKNKNNVYQKIDAKGNFVASSTLDTYRFSEETDRNNCGSVPAQCKETSSSSQTDDTKTNISFKVISKVVKDGKNVPVNTAKIALRSSKETLGVCTTSEAGTCSVTKTEMKRRIESLQQTLKEDAAETGDDTAQQIGILAYKPFKNQKTIESSVQNASTEKEEFEFTMELDEKQSSQTTNYTAQGVSGVDGNLPVLGNNSIVFSAKRESNEGLVRIGGVSFELTGRVSKSAKAAESNKAGVKDSSDEDSSDAKDKSDTGKDKDKAVQKKGEPSTSSNLKALLSTGSSIKTIKGVIPDDGNLSKITIPNLPDGTYQLVLRKNSFVSKTVSNIKLEGGQIADYDTIQSGKESENAILLEPKSGAEPPALPDGYKANKVPLSKDYLVASRGDYVANAEGNLYYSFIEPRPGWTTNIIVEKQLDLTDKKDQKKLEKMVDDCVEKQSGMNMSFGANVSSSTLKNLGYFNAFYRLFLNKDKTQSDQESLMEAITGVGLTQILSKDKSGIFNVNFDLFDKCGISRSIIRNPSYNYNGTSSSNFTIGGVDVGSLLGLYLSGRDSTYNGTYYGDDLTLEYCVSINQVMHIIADQQQERDKLLCQQRYGSKLLLAQLGLGGLGTLGTSSSSSSTISSLVASEFRKLRSCAGTKLFLSESPLVYTQSQAQETILVIQNEYEKCSADRSNYTPSSDWRDFDFLRTYGFLDGTTTRNNKVLSNAFQAFKSCAGSQLSSSLRAPTPSSSYVAQTIFTKMVDEYESCIVDRKSYTIGSEWSDIQGFLIPMGFLYN